MKIETEIKIQANLVDTSKAKELVIQFLEQLEEERPSLLVGNDKVKVFIEHNPEFVAGRLAIEVGGQSFAYIENKLQEELQ